MNQKSDTIQFVDRIVAIAILLVFAACYASRINLGSGPAEKRFSTPWEEADAPTAREWCNWAENCRLQGDRKGMIKCEAKAKAALMKQLKLPEGDTPTSASQLLLCLAGHHACCQDWAEAVECYNLALNDFYPKRPKALKKDAGRVGADVYLAVLRRDRGAALIKLGKFDKARKDFETALKLLEAKKSADAPRTLPSTVLARIRETIRLDLAETLAKLGEPAAAAKNLRMVHENLKAAGAQPDPGDQRRLAAALERAGMKREAAEYRPIQQAMTSPATGGDGCCGAAPKESAKKETTRSTAAGDGCCGATADQGTTKTSEIAAERAGKTAQAPAAAQGCRCGAP